MARCMKPAGIFLAIILFLSTLFAADLWAFSITGNQKFTEGPYLFQVEVQVNGHGSFKKKNMEMTSLKVKIKNDRASSQMLIVKSVRAYPNPRIHREIETKGYSVTPAQWVTKYYRLPKDKQVLLGEQASIEIAFETFTIRFSPRGRKFEGPLK